MSRLRRCLRIFSVEIRKVAGITSGDIKCREILCLVFYFFKFFINITT